MHFCQDAFNIRRLLLESVVLFINGRLVFDWCQSRQLWRFVYFIVNVVGESRRKCQRNDSRQEMWMSIREFYGGELSNSHLLSSKASQD